MIPVLAARERSIKSVAEDNFIIKGSDEYVRHHKSRLEAFQGKSSGVAGKLYGQTFKRIDILYSFVCLEFELCFCVAGR